PTGSSGKTNPPLLSVNTLRDKLVAVFVTVTRALGTSAPCASVTVPNNEAVSRACANAESGRAIRKGIKQAKTTVLRSIPLPFTCVVETQIIVLIDLSDTRSQEKKRV